MFEITRLMSLDVSIFFILISATFLYFGEIISSTRVEKYSKSGHYLEGLYFFVMNLYIPILFSYYISSKNLFTISYFVLIGIQVVIFVFLYWNIMANEIRRYEMSDIIEKEIEHNSFIAKNKDKYNWDLKEPIEIAFKKIPVKIFGNKLILMFFSFLTIISNIQLYEYGNLLILGLSLLFAFIIFTMNALAYGFNTAQHPMGKICMVDGNIIEGKILKFGKYVQVLKDDKKIFINQDKINFIEESKYK